MKKKLKPLTKKEHGQLFAQVDWEGFGYYMLHAGPDLSAIERLGFNRKEVESAVELFRDLEAKIMEGEEFAEDDSHD